MRACLGVLVCVFALVAVPAFAQKGPPSGTVKRDAQTGAAIVEIVVTDTGIAEGDYLVQRNPPSLVTRPPISEVEFSNGGPTDVTIRIGTFSFLLPPASFRRIPLAQIAAGLQGEALAAFSVHRSDGSPVPDGTGYFIAREPGTQPAAAPSAVPSAVGQMLENDPRTRLASATVRDAAPAGPASGAQKPSWTHRPPRRRNWSVRGPSRFR